MGAVSLSALRADDLEIAVGVELIALLGKITIRSKDADRPNPVPLAAPPVDFPISPVSSRLEDFAMKSSKPKEWTDIERKKLSAMIRRRFGAAEIAAALRRHTGSVKRTAREMGLILKK
ncbi:hypothetical protein [Bradyrhizobium sp. Cp5.3]|uniref:hypothetical protein n=1 Tax=Bradyrhizobium sp. Cp5.3 TaxID=443598 RepID=UPI000485E6D2|nr:hypothetical protein [Bradyrhizobium sp. Cp5.3]